ncbi:MAG: hypothetical protein R2932_20350 [Caldilineaceae bacterium]
MSIKLDFVNNSSNAGFRNLTFDVDGGGSGGTPKKRIHYQCGCPRQGCHHHLRKNPVAWGVMNSSMSQVFANNRDKLSYVFAQINLVPPQASSWLAPQEIELRVPGRQRRFL